MSVITENKIKALVGKTWLYKTTNHKVLYYKIENDTVIIGTNIEPLVFQMEGIEKELDRFLPCDEDAPRGRKKADLPVKTEEAVVLSPSENNAEIAKIVNFSEGLAPVKSILLENIRDIKEGKDIIEKSRAINETVNSLVNIMKIEIMIANLKFKHKN